MPSVQLPRVAEIDIIFMLMHEIWHQSRERASVEGKTTRGAEDGRGVRPKTWVQRHSDRRTRHQTPRGWAPERRSGSPRAAQSYRNRDWCCRRHGLSSAGRRTGQSKRTARRARPAGQPADPDTARALRTWVGPWGLARKPARPRSCQGNHRRRAANRAARFDSLADNQPRLCRSWREPTHWLAALWQRLQEFEFG